MTTTAMTRRRWRRPLSVEAVTIPRSHHTMRITTRVPSRGGSFSVLGGQQGRRLGGGAANAPWAPGPPSVTFALSCSRA